MIWKDRPQSDNVIDHREKETGVKDWVKLYSIDPNMPGYYYRNLATGDTIIGASEMEFQLRVHFPFLFETGFYVRTILIFFVLFGLIYILRNGF